MELLKQLNENQYKAVTTTEGPLLILAGAGSGKTRVITYRIAHLIKQKAIAPYSIMAVTFTNKAAAEMRNRITSLIGATGEHVFIKTFHSASVYILRRYGEHIGIPSSFSIYDSKDQETVVKEILLEMKIDPKKHRPAALVSKISEIKDKAELSSVADRSLLYPDNYPFDFGDLYDSYQERLKVRNALDFNDLLIKTVKLLQSSEEVLTKLQNKWQYLMIDEYQDTNKAQYLISKYLATKHKNICVVGDDDQSIYSWRGADIRNILDFEKDYPNAKVVKLEENYRSSKPILDAAAAVIKNNTERKGKDLISFKGDGELPIWCRANNEYGESEFVTNKIVTLKKQEALKNKDFAIFYRTNAQSRIFEDYLRRENIPYRIVGGLKFYDRKEIKDIAAYLKFIVNPFDTVALMRIINTPARGIGPKTIENLRNQAYMERISEWEIIDKEIPINGKLPKGLKQFKDVIINGMLLNAEIPEKSKLSKLVTDIIDNSGIRASLENENSIESKSRLENIDEFINSVFEYETKDPDVTLDQFLQEISLATSEENPNPDDTNSDPTNTVTLMTVHNAKGLEYPVVFLTGMEEGTFPHFNSSDTDEGIEEERRLCYVGITRAMDHLYISSAEFRRSFSGISYKEPSRFLYEIPGENIETHDYQESSSKYNSSFSSTKYSSSTKKSDNLEFNSFKKKTTSPAAKHSSSKFSLKERVSHPKYGRGKIVSIEGSGDNTKLSIVFDSAGLKSFLEKYTPIEKV